MKQSGIKQTAALILVMTIIFSIFSCSGGESLKSETDTFPASNEKTTEGETKILPDVPKRDYDGHIFTFMHYDSGVGSLNNKDLFAEGITGEVLNDAVYERNTSIENDYNIKIALQVINWEEIPNKMSTLIQSGDTSIDVYYPFGISVGPMFTSGLLYNLHDVPYIDFEKPWWDSNIVRDLTIDGKLYFVTTNINILDKAATSIMIFNKGLAKDHNCPDFYNLVNQNQWTIDKLGEVSKGVTADINGDSVMDVNDVYGLVGADTFIVALYYALGGDYTVIGSDGYPQSNILNDKSADIFDKIFKITYDAGVYQHIEWLGYPLAPEAVELFFTGNHSMLS